jgi:hypothetical protein
MKEKKVPDMIRNREMNDVRNYNRNQQQKVFENEKRQVAMYGDTQSPPSAKDIGSAFKLQVYVLKINQLLQAKTDAISALKLAVAGIPLAQLRGPTTAPYVNTVWGKSELLTAFNEMMAFIKIYMPDIFSSDRVRDNAYQSYLTPLSNNLTATQNLYPALNFELVPRGGSAQARSADDAVKKLFQEQSIQVFSMLGAMSEDIVIQRLRPINADDINTYAEKNGVEDIFARGGKAPQPTIPILPPGPAILPERQGQPLQPDQQGIQPVLPPPQSPPLSPRGSQQGSQAGSPRARSPSPVLPAPAQMQDPTNIDELVTLFAQANPDGVDPSRVLNKGAYGGQGDTNIRASIRQYAQTIGYTGATGKDPLNQAITRVKANLRQQGGPAQRSPSPQGQPAVAGPSLRTFRGYQAQVGDDVTDTGSVVNKMDLPTLFPDQQDARDARALVRNILDTVKIMEVQRQNVINPSDAGGVQAVVAELNQDGRIQPEFERLIGNDAGQQMVFVRRVLTAIKEVRQEFAQTEATDNNEPAYAQQSNQLWGQGKKRNAKAFLRGCGVPSDIINTSMMRHGLDDYSTVGDLEGSGIMDTLKNFAGSVADSASGWFDTIKANMPTMSDVRRAVGKIVPDSMSDYVPSGLKRTFGDKAKDFFGFGISGGEFRGDERPQISRHREPFVNFFDDKGYRQGAVDRMTRMFVPEYEVSSGLHNLKGGDQLSDLDPEVLRRQDHHDVSLYRPAVIQQPIHGYGHDGDEDEVGEGGLHQRLRKPMPFDSISRPYGKMPMMVHRVEDHDRFAPADNLGEELGHYMELEKPADMDEDPNPFRVRTENHKVNTGKMKKVTYHTK